MLMHKEKEVQSHSPLAMLNSAWLVELRQFILIFFSYSLCSLHMAEYIQETDLTIVVPFSRSHFQVKQHFKRGRLRT